MTDREPKTRRFLRELCARRGVGVEQLAVLARVSVFTAKSWLRPHTANAARVPPDGLVELVCIKLGERSPFT